MMKASELYELIIKDPVAKTVFREIGQRLGFGKVRNGGKAGNFNAIYAEVTFQAAGVEHRIAHNLGRTPVGMMLVSDLKPGTIIGGMVIQPTRPPDDKYIYLQSDIPGTTTVMLW
ncbi:MAG: hypothetical protein QXZ09_03515 [Candidatus Methanomethylicaceae archaeon]